MFVGSGLVMIMLVSSAHRSYVELWFDIVGISLMLIKKSSGPSNDP